MSGARCMWSTFLLHVVCPRDAISMRKKTLKISVRKLQLEKAKILCMTFSNCIAAAVWECTRETAVTFQACHTNAPNNTLKAIQQYPIQIPWEGFIPSYYMSRARGFQHFHWKKKLKRAEAVSHREISSSPQFQLDAVCSGLTSVTLINPCA